MKKILVTGGLGFIGSFLVERLIELGHQVDVVDDLSTGSMEWAIDGPNYFICDVVDFCEIGETDWKYDAIYHLANNARIALSFEQPQETLTNNYESTVHLLEKIRKNCPEAILYFASSSTTEFTDRFNNPYTFSKYVCDEVLSLYNTHYDIKYNVVKFYNVYGSMREKDLGEYTTVIRKFKKKVLEGSPLTVYNPERRRDFTSIQDTISALEILLDVDYKYPQVYHIGTGKNVSIQEIADAFDHPIEYFPNERNYELHTTLSHPNIPDWQAKDNVLDHIKEWRRVYATS
jgi:UDP-glucose 4-epimerase